MIMHTFNFQDKREYAVSVAAVPGRVVIAEASHPSSVDVNKEFSWHVVGHVENGVVRNPGIAYAYVDGPANAITLVGTDGSRETLEKGKFISLYYHADKDPCTNIDSREVYRGAIFPVAGNYTVWLLSGYLSEEEAAAGLSTFADLKKVKTSRLAGFAGFPVRITVAQAISMAGPLLLGLGLVVI